MKKLITFILLLFLYTTIISQDSFTRVDSILVPEIENCGFGEIVAGVDFDGDNMTEIYVVNNMNDLGGNELIPRIYKYEFNGISWELVWDEYSRDIVQQNSWAPITYGDWDKDSKNEIIWAPANNFTTGNENPPRILVWESNGDDKLGKANFGFETPNAQWTITDQDNFEVRPFKFILNDIDDDGNEELIFCDRRSNYRFGVVSISDVPDNGNGTETWTLEASALGSTLVESSIYDFEIIDQTIFLFHSDGSVTPVKYENGNYNILENIANVIPGGSWKSATSIDLDNDGNNEIVVAGWQVDAKAGNNKVFLLQADPDSVLKSTMIANFEELIDSAGRINGGHGAVGDVDGDGNLDFIFGTRSSTPQVAIIRMEYLGGDITDENNYELSVVDSLYPTANPGRYDIVKVANIDDDPEDEILYTNGATCERFPIVILDFNKPVSVEGQKLPDNFELTQNYPNPFNPSTNISFTIPFQEEITLKVYDMLGREVRTLLYKKQLTQGSYNIKFNADDLPSGVYAYSLIAKNNILTKKMILLK